MTSLERTGELCQQNDSIAADVQLLTLAPKPGDLVIIRVPSAATQHETQQLMNVTKDALKDLGMLESVGVIALYPDFELSTIDADLLASMGLQRIEKP